MNVPVFTEIKEQSTTSSVYRKRTANSYNSRISVFALQMKIPQLQQDFYSCTDEIGRSRLLNDLVEIENNIKMLKEGSKSIHTLSCGVKVHLIDILRVISVESWKKVEDCKDEEEELYLLEDAAGIDGVIRLLEKSSFLNR